MNNIRKEKLYGVLQSPVVTEKSTRAFDDDGQYVFYVDRSATRKDVKAAIEFAFEDRKVEVDSVRILNVKGKSKRFGQAPGRRNDRKKAYVRLKPGSEIDFADYQA